MKFFKQFKQLGGATIIALILNGLADVASAQNAGVESICENMSVEQCFSNIEDGDRKEVSFDYDLAQQVADRLELDCTGQGVYGVEHGRYHQKYSTLYNQEGTHCCNDGDCRPTEARYDKVTGNWVACVNEQPILIKPFMHIPPDQAYGLGNIAHVCVGASGTRYCFIKPYGGG